MKDVAVIGAGLAGLACATELERHGISVDLFDKGRAPGGRISTRRSSAGTFDHGAQYFTVRDPAFAGLVRELLRAGVVERWSGRFARASATGELQAAATREARWVGTPGMSAIGRALASSLDVRSGVRVGAIRRHASDWDLVGDGGTALGRYARVVVATPAPQSAELLHDTPLMGLAERAQMAPCWALMIGFVEQPRTPFDAIQCEGDGLSWIAREASKPGRAKGPRWVAHASPAFTRRHAGASPEVAGQLMLDELQKLLGSLPPVASSVAHLWRYALVERPVGAEALYDPTAGLGACGDWCVGGRVEAAVLSGLRLADSMMEGRPMRPTIPPPMDERLRAGAIAGNGVRSADRVAAAEAAVAEG